jgi:large subunit ribosomal protein L21
MKYAIIRSGGKQYRCVEGAAIEVDRLPVEAGATHVFDEVLLVVNDGAVTVGAPTIAGGLVTAKVEGQIKGPKTISFRYKAKERQRTKRGHRAQYTRLQIEKIEG